VRLVYIGRVEDSLFSYCNITVCIAGDKWGLNHIPPRFGVTRRDDIQLLCRRKNRCVYAQYRSKDITKIVDNVL